MKDKFQAGINIAIKIPRSKYDQTVAFYRDILKLEVCEVTIEHPTVSKSHKVRFGANILWLDCVDNYTQGEIWLQLTVPDVEASVKYLQTNGVDTCDEIEALPPGMHWIQDPAGNVFNLQKRTDEPVAE